MQAQAEPINWILDATFFSRTDGLLVFRSNKTNLFWYNITSETIAVIDAGLDVLDKEATSSKVLL